MGSIYSYFYPKPKPEPETSVDQVLMRRAPGDLSPWEIEDMIRVDKEARRGKETHALEFMREPRPISDPIPIPATKKNISCHIRCVKDTAIR